MELQSVLDVSSATFAYIKNCTANYSFSHKSLLKLCDLRFSFANSASIKAVHKSIFPHINPHWPSIRWKITRHQRKRIIRYIQEGFCSGTVFENNSPVKSTGWKGQAYFCLYIRIIYDRIGSGLYPVSIKTALKRIPGKKEASAISCRIRDDRDHARLLLPQFPGTVEGGWGNIFFFTYPTLTTGRANR